MGLRTLRPGLAVLAPAVAVRSVATEAARTAAAPWRAWYKTAAWQRVSWKVRVKARFTCALCGRIEGRKGQTVADHVVPHRGDAGLFWDEGNLQCLCKPCHDSAKQAEERPGAGVASPHPKWFRPVHLPLTIVCGPPGAGKSTYVAKNAGAGDLVICWDTIARELFGVGRLSLDPSDDRFVRILRRRNEMIGDLMRVAMARRWPAAWLILTEPLAARRAWWDERLRPRAVVVLETPADVCLARVAADAERGDVRSKRAVATIAGWWRRYRPRDAETVVAWEGGRKTLESDQIEDRRA